MQALAAGAGHSCALVNGSVQCWGDNTAGDLGDGLYTPSPVPAVVQTLTNDGGQVPLGSGVQALAAGTQFSCALLNGGVQCWGNNDHGQFGDNSTVTIKVAVPGLATGLQSLVAGGSHACALVGGGVQCWGDNQYGELGNGSTATFSTVPVPVAQWAR